MHTVHHTPEPDSAGEGQIRETLEEERMLDHDPTRRQQQAPSQLLHPAAAVFSRVV